MCYFFFYLHQRYGLHGRLNSHVSPLRLSVVLLFNRHRASQQSAQPGTILSLRHSALSVTVSSRAITRLARSHVSLPTYCGILNAKQQQAKKRGTAFPHSGISSATTIPLPNSDSRQTPKPSHTIRERSNATSAAGKAVCLINRRINAEETRRLGCRVYAVGTMLFPRHPTETMAHCWPSHCGGGSPEKRTTPEVGLVN